MPAILPHRTHTVHHRGEQSLADVNATLGAPHII